MVKCIIVTRNILKMKTRIEAIFWATVIVFDFFLLLLPNRQGNTESGIDQLNFIIGN